MGAGNAPPLVSWQRPPASRSGRRAVSAELYRAQCPSAAAYALVYAHADVSCRLRQPGAVRIAGPVEWFPLTAHQDAGQPGAARVSHLLFAAFASGGTPARDWDEHRLECSI